jgi:hypothetical protein
LGSQFDIVCLTRLVASGQKQQQSRSALRVVDPVTRAYVDLEFADATGQVAMLPRIATDQALDPYEDSSPTRAILE